MLSNKYLGLIFILMITILAFSYCTGNKKSITDLSNGLQVYNKSCYTCHAAGIAGAAKLSDTNRWQASAKKSQGVLLQQVIHGFNRTNGVLPARGSCGDCSNQDLSDAIAYMFSEAGIGF